MFTYRLPPKFQHKRPHLFVLICLTNGSLRVHIPLDRLSKVLFIVLVQSVQSTLQHTQNNTIREHDEYNDKNVSCRCSTVY